MKYSDILPGDVLIYDHLNGKKAAEAYLVIGVQTKGVTRRSLDGHTTLCTQEIFITYMMMWGPLHYRGINTLSVDVDVEFSNPRQYAWRP